MTRSSSNPRTTSLRNRLAIRPKAEGLECRLLMSAGDLDPTFDTDGYALIASGGSGAASAVQPLASGKILVASYDNGGFGLLRLNSNGALDATFGSGGRVASTPGLAKAIAIQSDGRIVLAGEVITQVKGSVADRDFAIVRYLSDGLLDTNFGPSHNGKVITPISTVANNNAPGANKADYVYAVAIQPADQKILVGGGVYAGLTSDGNASYDSALVRYNTDGSLDSSFGQGGKLVIAVGVGAANDEVQDIELLPDGRIIVVGYAGDASNRLMMYLARYEANGTPDTTFGIDGSGRVLMGVGTTNNTKGTSLDLQSDGRLVVSGYCGPTGSFDVLVARFTSTGSLDNTFGGGAGFVVLDGGGTEYARDMVVQADDKIVVAGRNILGPSGNTVTHSFVARFLPDGTPDSGFGGDGFVGYSFSATIDYFQGVAVQDGKIIAVGSNRIVSRKTTLDNILIARIQGDSAPLLAASASVTPIKQTLTPAQARPVLTQALAAWRARGVDTSRLGHIDIAIADLGGNRLGEASGSTITLDDDAAGWGWNIGRAAGRGRKSVSGRMDLLSALVHEVGHLLGRSHAEGGVMAETLAPGVRQIATNRVIVTDTTSGRDHPLATIPGASSRLSLRAFRGHGWKTRVTVQG